MRCARLIGISSMVLAVVAGAACGSSEPSASTPTTSPKRLNLTSTGSTADATADAAMPAIYPARPTRYVLDAPLPDLGASAPVQRMNGHPVNEADVRRIAEALGIAGSPVRTATGWELPGNDGALSIDLSGGTVRVSYSRGVPTAVDGSTGSGSTGSGGATTPAGGAPDADPDVAPTEPAPVPTPPTTFVKPVLPVDVPAPADAQTIARTLLDRMGVLGSQSWSAAVNDSGDAAVTCAADGPCPSVPPVVSARTVTFSLVVDGKRVNGVDWSVTIGEHRRVESVYGEWASPTTLGSYPLLSTAAAFADLKDGTARYPGPQPMAAGAAEGDVAVDLPATDLPATDLPTTDLPTTDLPTTTPLALEVHITGVSLGLARWDEIDQGNAVVDLVPTYEFHARIDGGTPYDIVVLALEPSAVTWVKPPAPEPAPAPEPGPAPVPEPGPAPVPEPAQTREPLPSEKNG